MMMKKERLEALSDGIFAISMTLLAIEIRVPELSGVVTNQGLFSILAEAYPLFLSFVLSFALLFTYWRAHNYLMSVFAKNIDSRLTNYNAVFFLFVVLVPFSSYMLGRYSEAQLAVVIIALNTIFIGLTQILMRNYIINSESIDNVEFTPRDMRHGSIRIMFPVVCAALAMLLSFADITVAMGLFTLAVLFNLSHFSTSLLDKIFFKKALAREEGAPK